MTVEEVCREFSIAESTWARWLGQYGGMKADDAKRLKERERERPPEEAHAELEKAILTRGKLLTRTGDGPP